MFCDQKQGQLLQGDCPDCQPTYMACPSCQDDYIQSQLKCQCLTDQQKYHHYYDRINQVYPHPFQGNSAKCRICNHVICFK